ncbi:BACON domain-containing protein, partial [Bacteroides thetaiotaomicron]
MKKLYSNTLMQLILALCTFSFVACQEFDIDSQPEGPLNIQIDALESYTALATSPSNVVFNISSNTPWTIESDQQWCKPTPSMSAASSLVSEIVVTMENNTGKKARTAKLTIKAEGVEGTKVVTIEQASKEDLVVVPYDELVPTEGGSITFTIASNKAWEIIPSTAFLSNIDKTSGTGNEDAIAETVTVTLPANAGAKRAGTLTVKTEFEEYTFTITQNGVIIELEEDPESTTISMPGTGSG